MNGHSFSNLRHFDKELVGHFKALRLQRGDKPIFLIEHGLDDDMLGEMRRHVGAHARLAGLGQGSWIGASLPLAVVITETGYSYRGTGTEFWPRFAADIGAGITQAERADIRATFETLNTRLMAASPNESDWARAFNIIAWPIRNALAPIEIHRPLAEALGRLAATGGHNLAGEDFQRRLVAIADGLWSRRLSDWLRDEDLAVGLCRNLLSGEDTATWIEPRAAARIARDIRADRDCRQALRQARRTIRAPGRVSTGELEAASWSVSVSLTDEGPKIERLLLQGPVTTQRLRETILSEIGHSATLRVNGSDSRNVLVEQFLRGEAIELRDITAAWRGDLLTFSGTIHNDVLQPLIPRPPLLFRWNEMGGILQSLKRGEVIYRDELLLNLAYSESGQQEIPTESLEIMAHENLIAWIAPADKCDLPLREFVVRPRDDRLVEFKGAARLRIEGNRIQHPNDTLLFLRACVNGLRLRLKGSLDLPSTLSVGDIVLIPTSLGSTELEVLSEQRRETWQIEPVSEFRSTVFSCQARPTRPTIDDLLSGELALIISSPIALDETPVEVQIQLNGECIATSSMKLRGLPARIDALAPEFVPIREAAFAERNREGENHLLLRLKIGRLQSFQFDLQERRSSWERRASSLEWIGENGVTAEPASAASASAPMHFENATRAMKTEGDDIRLWLPGIPESNALVEGIITGKAQLFGQLKSPTIGRVSRTPRPFREDQGIIATCEALIAWQSATTQDMLAESRRNAVLRTLDDALTSSFCGHEWLVAERADLGAAGYNVLLAKASTAFCRGGFLPEISAADRKTFTDLLAVRLEEALPFERPPGWTLDDSTVIALDAAINQAYSDLSIIIETRGEEPLEDPDAGNELDDWIRASEEAHRQLESSPFRRLILPQARWHQLEATEYESLSDDDLVELLTKSHVDISRTQGREWISPSAIRSGLALWISPADLLNTQDWRQHMAHLLSDRHTSRAIRYVARRSCDRQRQPAASSREAYK